MAGPAFDVVVIGSGFGGGVDPEVRVCDPEPCPETETTTGGTGGWTRAPGPSSRPYSPGFPGRFRPSPSGFAKRGS